MSLQSSLAALQKYSRVKAEVLVVKFGSKFNRVKNATEFDTIKSPHKFDRI